MANKVIIYSSSCGGVLVQKHTIAMNSLVTSVGCASVQVTYIDIDGADKQMVWDKSGMKGKYPLLFVDDEFVGDYQAVIDLNEDGLLRPKLGIA